MAHTAHNPPELFNSLQYGFSQITVAQGTRMVFISGQVGWDADETPVEGFAAQTSQALRNLETAITTVGGTMADITTLRIYFRAEMRDALGHITPRLKAAFPQDPPATSWVGVQTLSRENILIEIEATAVLA